MKSVEDSILQIADCRLQNGSPRSGHFQFSIFNFQFSIAEPSVVRWVLRFAIVVLALTSIPIAAQDTVTIAAGNEGGKTRIGGRILDYNGRELHMQVAGGLEKSFPTPKILRVETQYEPQHVQADVALAQGRFEEALALYQKAVKSEPRRWVRRKIIAQWVWCYRALGRADRACEAFLLLLRDDPDTPYFDCIPLAWLPRQPSAAMEQTARAWLGRQEPAAVLLGASYLLTTNKRAGALTKLRKLTTASDTRIAQMALAQTWRATDAGADEQEIDAIQLAIERIPEPLRAGPYFVLGAALLGRQQWEQAALALMRVPILYPQHRLLAARSLVDVGRAMQRLGRTAEAVRLYRELLHTYAEQRQAVAEAESRLQAMMNDE